MTEAVEDVGTNALAPEPAPVVETPVEAVADASIEAVAEAQPELDLGVETPEPKPGKDKGAYQAPKWAIERINENQNKADRLAEEKAQAQRELAEAKALLERMQGGEKDNQPRRTDEPQDLEALIEARAEQKLFNNDCNAVAQKGQSEIAGFNDKLGLLRSIGVVNDEFLKDIFAIDKDGAHTILDSLSQDPERASMMVKMNSRTRIAALTRMQMAEAAKPAPAVPVVRSGVSKVPAPKPVIEAISDNVGEMDLTNDKLDDQTWSKMWDKKYRKKA